MAETQDKLTSPATTAGAKAKKREMGFSIEGKAYPGVDPDTGERKAVTWEGLRAEFGERKGSRLYNDLAVAAFGGVQPGRPDLSLATTDERWFRARLKNQQGDFSETEEAYEKARGKFRARAEKVKKILADAEAESAKENN
jgi:hypothetical protein